MSDCDHRWNDSSEVRICLSCGQVSTFPTNGDNRRICWPGKGAEQDPQELGSLDKSLIAHAAQRLGIRQAADLTGIGWKLLRAWVGAYCRREETLEPLPAAEAAIAKPIALIKITLGSCFFCFGEAVNSGMPYCIKGRNAQVVLCSNCAQRVQALFDTLEINYQVVPGTAGFEPRQREPEQPVSREKYDMPVASLGLSARTLNCLRHSSITELGELLKKTPEELLRIHDFGQGSLRQVSLKLKEKGFKLAEVRSA